MSQSVPATTRIRRNRAHNVDSDRLQRRQEFLSGTLNGADIDRRGDFAVRAAEMHAIENVLEDRGVTFNRRSTRS